MLEQLELNIMLISSEGTQMLVPNEKELHYYKQTNDIIIKPVSNMKN